MIRIALFLAGFSLAATPSFAQQLDPVKGPMALQAPGPFYEGSKGGGTYGYSIKSDFGRVKSFSYAKGETLKGKCDSATAAPVDTTASALSGNSSPQQNLAAVWDLIYGPGYYGAHVAGKQVLEGTFSGDKGTILHVQSLDHFVAVGTDNQGNLFKIVW